MLLLPHGGARSLSRRERVWLAVALVGAFAFLVWGIGRPSLWYDEIATLSASARSLPDLFALTGHVDAVHGAYYTLMHAVVAVLGESETALRLPSAACAALASAGVYALARRFAGVAPSAGAAVLFLLLPRTTWMAVEARSFAVFSLVLIALGLVWVQALVAPRRWPWAVAYGVLAWLSVSLYLFTALVVAAQVLALLGALALRPSARAALWARTWPLLVAAAIAAAASVPLAGWVSAQQGQLGGTRPISTHTPAQLAVEALFLTSRPGALAAIALVSLAIAVVAVRLARARINAARTSEPVNTAVAAEGTVTVPVGWLLWSWAILPPAALIGVTAAGTVVFQPRQLTMIAPALCIGAALLIFRAAPRPAAWVAVALIAALCAPVWWFTRAPEAKGTDWREVAQTLSATASPGDAVVFSPSWISGAAVRYATPLIPLAYPETRGFDEPALVRTPLDAQSLFGDRYPLADIDLSGRDRIWLVSSRAAEIDAVSSGSAQTEEGDSAARVAADRATLEAAGFHLDNSVETPLSRLELWTR